MIEIFKKQMKACYCHYGPSSENKKELLPLLRKFKEKIRLL